jgi:beta-phosphoglucomutase-like phosphatase (HAD superfamily)
MRSRHMNESNHFGPKYRAVLFDFDSTLTPSLPLWVKGYRIALGSGFGLELSDDEIIERCFFRDWGDLAADLGIASVEELRLKVQFGVHEAFLEAQLFPLARPLLEHCRAHGMQTALVTSSLRATQPDHVFADHTELPALLGLPALAEDVVLRHAV